MGLEQLMDGALCTGVLVEASSDVVVKALGAPRTDESEAEPSAYVAELAGTGWCRIEFTAEVAQSERAYDSDPLLGESVSAMNDVPSQGPMGADTPVRNARRLSQELGVAAIGIWASDQGPGIGGAVRFDAGRRDWCFSAASPEDIELIDRVRDIEQTSVLSEELEDSFDALDERSCEQTWSATGVLEGEVSEHVDQALSDLGIDPDWIDEPLWALAAAPTQLDEISRLVRVD